MIPTREEQIVALIEGNAVMLVEKFIPKDRWSIESYKEVFTIKLSDIVDYLEKNSVMENRVNADAGEEDGFYALPSSDGYEVYEQERGFKENSAHVTSVSEVWKRYAEYLVSTSGTGLDFK